MLVLFCDGYGFNPSSGPIIFSSRFFFICLHIYLVKKWKRIVSAYRHKIHIKHFETMIFITNLACSSSYKGTLASSLPALLVVHLCRSRSFSLANTSRHVSHFLNRHLTAWRFRPCGFENTLKQNVSKTYRVLLRHFFNNQLMHETLGLTKHLDIAKSINQLTEKLPLKVLIYLFKNFIYRHKGH